MFSGPDLIPLNCQFVDQLFLFFFVISVIACSFVCHNAPLSYSVYHQLWYHNIMADQREPKLNFKGPYSSSEKEIKFRRCLFMSSIKRKIRHFHVVVAKTGKKCTKKGDARAKLLFCLLNQLFFDVLVAVRVVGSSSPYY